MTVEQVRRTSNGSVRVPTRPPDGAPRATRAGSRVIDSWWVRLAVALALLVGVVLRTRTASELWLDEAQAVHIAGLPLSQLPEALRHDGAPPLYYLLLHGWISVFGRGNLAVRSLSGVFSVAALPLMFALGRRYAGREGGWIAVLLLASSPFAVAYATTARMYALMLLLVVAGALLVIRLLERPNRRDTALLALCAAALMLTHYWAAFLLVTLGALLLVLRSYPSQRRGATYGLAALCGGGVLALPWVPILLYQLRHTGSPWSAPAGGRAVADAVAQWTGGVGTAWQSLLHLAVLALGFLAIFGRPLDRNRLELDLRGRRRALPVLALSIGTLIVSVAIAHFLGSAYVPRYTTAAFVPFVLLLTLGTQALPLPAWRPALLAAVVALGLLGSVRYLVDDSRTQAGQVAAVLARTSQPGDVVAYCPDQLGPAVSRIAPRGLVQGTYPNNGSPAMVDWIDYAQRNALASPRAYAESLLQQARGHQLFLVWAPGYRTLNGACETIARTLRSNAPAAHRQLVRSNPRFFEFEYLDRYRPR